jgi:transcriptional regulator with XRE-family HTH domain
MNETPGERIARARRRRGLSQAVLAGLVGRSESWLSQVERGKRGVDSHAVLTRMAVVLRVEVDELTGPDGGREEGQRGYKPAVQIEQAMTFYDAAVVSIGGRGPEGTGSVEHLHAMARAAYQGYQATRYDDTGRVLPALIREVEAASRAAGLDNPQMCAVRAVVYDTAAALLNRVGETALAWAAADRALSAAEQSGRPSLAAAAALERTMRATDADALSVYGALHLAAATAAAAIYDRAMTASLLAKARETAEATGESNRMGTAFGHANVSIHAISAALQLGDAKTAIETGEALDLAALPAGCTGRRTQLHLDLARAYAMRRQDAAAVNLLLAAERLSPQLVRYDAQTRGVITTLLGREHQPSTPELRPLARRAGVI